MTTDSCHLIRDALVAYFNEQVEVTADGHQCVITLPIKTLDDRFVDVWVEPKLADHVLVHDGGKTLAELFAQGIHLTDTQTAHIQAVARRHGVTIQSGVFQIVGPASMVQAAVFAIAQCATLAMMPLAGHEPVYEDEPITARVGRALREWKPEYVDLRRRVKVKGRHASHKFDWVSYPKRKGLSTVAVKVLPYGYGPLIQTARYGFMVLDVENRVTGKWPRLAVIARADEWPPSTLEVVRELSAETLEVEAGREDRIDTALPKIMSALTEAA
jgi:hypothetical protein